jgi:hypothetical protein
VRKSDSVAQSFKFSVFLFSSVFRLKNNQLKSLYTIVCDYV